MADPIVTDIPPINQYTAAGGQTVFNFAFLAFAQTDVVAYQTPAGVLPNDATQILTYNVDYTVALNPLPALGGGIILMVGAGAGDTITIVRAMPDNRLNNYIAGGLFQATTVNTDFDRTVLMAQQNKLYDQNVGVHYNLSSTPVVAVDTYLPVLPANSFWMKNAGNTAIVAATTFGSGSGSVTVPTVTDKFVFSTNTTGNLASSIFTKPVADGTAGQAMVTDGFGNLSFHTFQSFTWTVIFASQAFMANNGYVTNGGGLVTLTLPAVAAVGDTFRVTNVSAAGWLIAQRALQGILIGNVLTTIGVGGSLASTDLGDSVELICVVANLRFVAQSMLGNITVV